MKILNTKGEIVEFKPMSLDKNNKGHWLIIAPARTGMSKSLDLRLSPMNSGSRIGLIASNVDDDIVHIATEKETK